MLRSIFFVTCVSLATLAGTAYAEDSDNTLQKVVSARGVNFSDARQTARFYKELQRAAYDVCDVSGDSFSVLKDNRQCEEQAMDQAVADMQRPSLARYHAEITSLDTDRRLAAEQMADATPASHP